MILTALVFLLLSALFSGSEIGFISSNKLKVEIKTTDQGNKGKIFKSFFENPQDFIASMLVGNNIALVIFTYLITKLLSPLLEQYLHNELVILLIVTAIITLIVLLFGEYLPKIFFRIYGEDLLFGLTYPLYFLRKILLIPSKVTLGFSDILLRRFYKQEEDISENFLTRSELEQFIITSTNDEDDSVDTEMLQRALSMKETRVRDCMIPRPEIVSIEVQEDIEELKQLFAKTKLSKIIVYDEDIDHIVGYVHHQQMLDAPKDIKGLYLKITVVPEVTPVKKLMNLFIRNGSSIACVVDEFGGTSGIITLEDILEELFGEIEDEFDEEDEMERKISENEYLFAGRLEIDYLNDKYERIDIPKGDYNTLSGYVVQKLQNIPQEGQILETEKYIFIIYSVGQKKIELIKIMVKEQ